MKLTKLFQPIRIGNLELKNRIKLPAMGIAFEENGYVSDQTKACYAERARGGVALIGISCTTTRLQQGPLYGIYDDTFIPGLKELVDVIHKNGAKTYAQMGVGYNWAFGNGPVELVSPSGITPTGKPGSAFRLGGPYEPTMPKALSIKEIHQMVETFGDGAIRAKKAGFDAVEVIASVSYIISQFLSPITNKRTDEYGGSLENRMRFLLEIVEIIKRKAGVDYPITCRLSGADLMEPKGYDLEETKKMAVILEKAGVCQIDVMSGWHYASVAIIQTHVPQGNWVYMAEAVKSAVKIPIAAGTQIQDPVVAEHVLSEGKADMVYMARALVADPEMLNKAKDGQLKDIRPCMNCCRCISGVDSPPIYCSVNARMGRELEYPYEKPAGSGKKVLVVGGGPSGMEAARIASLRGHKVTLYDRNPRLGGSLLLASVTNPRIEPVMHYMIREVEKLPIDIKLHTEASVPLIEKFRPDVLILACGGAARPLDIPIEDGNILLDRTDMQSIVSGQISRKGSFTKRLISAFATLYVKYLYDPQVIRRFLKFSYPFGKRVTILSGNFAGCELGDTLSERGKQVTIVEGSSRIGADIEITHRWLFLSRLKKAGAKIFKKTTAKKITSRGVLVDHEGTITTINADTVVNVGITGNPGLVKELEGKIPVMYVIGDAAEPGKLLEAVASGFLTGQKI